MKTLDSPFSPNLNGVEKRNSPFLDANSTGGLSGEVLAHSAIQVAFSSVLPTQKVTVVSQKDKLMG
jgi:hypothetical protein